MKTYHCDGCGALVFFENISCLNCDHTLGFLPAARDLIAIEPAEDETWKGFSDKAAYRLCNNSKQHETCNWLVAADDACEYCVSCRLNAMIPNLDAPGNQERWRRLEMAKRRLIYSILQLRLPMNADGNRPGLGFRFLGDVAGAGPVTTGHEKGLITINIAEADDDERERRRVSLHEPFRTLLGHFRHEVGHYYFDRLIAGSSWLNRWRGLFGDETHDYGAAMKAYYERGPARDWQSRCVTAYASSHPWEDWAETWAHYFHMVDTLETAASFGITIRPRHPASKSMTADLRGLEGRTASFDEMMGHWYPVTYAVNSLNRGMGLQDLYLFALSTATVEKLRFIDEVIRASGVDETAGPANNQWQDSNQGKEYEQTCNCA